MKLRTTLLVLLAAMFATSVAADTRRFLDDYRLVPNAAIPGHNNKHLTNVTRAQCAKRCTNQKAFRCKSFDYYKGKKACDLSNKRASEVGGLKRNYPGNPYDHYTRKRAAATRFLKQFRKVPNAAIAGHNTRHLTNVTREQCAKRCVKAKAFQCKSFDYYKGKKACDLSNKRASEVGGLKRNYPGNPYDHYSRKRKGGS